MIAANNTATKVGQAGGDEEEKSSDPQSTQDTTDADAENQRNEQLKANWTNQFLEQQGFNFILSHFLAKEVNNSVAVNFSEQASLKDVAFLMTLLNVFLQAGFKS